MYPIGNKRTEIICTKCLEPFQILKAYHKFRSGMGQENFYCSIECARGKRMKGIIPFCDQIKIIHTCLVIGTPHKKVYEKFEQYFPNQNQLSVWVGNQFYNKRLIKLSLMSFIKDRL